MTKLSGPPAWERAAVFASLIYFASKAVFFALNVDAGIFPDESTHFGICQAFSRVPFLPVDTPDTYPLGLVTHIPPLYYLLMGTVLKIAGSVAAELALLRLMNVALGVLSVWWGYKVVSLLSSRADVRILVVVLLTNTLMFTFLFSAVSYDNLANFLAILSLYFAVLFLQEKTVRHFYLAGIFLLLGSLTKIAFLPYAVAILLATLVHDCSRLGLLKTSFRRILWPDGRAHRLLAVSCLGLLAWCGHLYIGNWLRFGSLTPSPDQVLSIEQAMQNRIFARNRIIAEYKSGSLSLQEAATLARRIGEEGDRQATLQLLDHAAREAAGGQTPRIDRFHYAFAWTDLMTARTFGFLGHRSLEKRGAALVPYYLLFMVSIFLWIRHSSRSDLRGFAGYLLLIWGAYSIFLMQAVNYREYFVTGVIVQAIQGRYLFPVLVPFFVLFIQSMMAYPSRPWRWLLGGLTVAVFVYGDLPWLLQTMPQGWLF